MKKTILTASILAIAFSGCTPATSNLTVYNNQDEYKGTYTRDNSMYIMGKGTIEFKKNDSIFKGKCKTQLRFKDGIRDVSGTCFVKNKDIGMSCSIKNSQYDGAIESGKCKDSKGSEYTIMGD